MEDRMCFEVDDKMDMDEVIMTVDKMIDIFSSFPFYTDWHVQLLKIKTDKNNKTIYTGREISLHPRGAVKSLVDEISKRYSNSKNGILRSYTDVRKYDGSTINDVIYWLKSNDVLISDDYNNCYYSPKKNKKKNVVNRSYPQNEEIFDEIK